MQSSRVVAFLILFLGFQCIQASGQQVVATWTDATGKWSNPANWSTLKVPNNGGGTTYDVVISGSFVTMNVRHVTIDNITLTGTTLNIKAGDSLSLVSGQSNNFGSTLTNYGTLNNSAMFVNVSSSSVIDNYAILNNRGIILNTDALNFINNGLVINSGAIGNVEATLVNNNTLINTGVLSAIVGIITNHGVLVSSSTGSISLGAFEGGQLNNLGTVINSGSIIGGGLETDDVSVIGNSGLLINRPNGSISEVASLTNQGILINNGSIQNACSVNGVCGYLNSGTLINNGSFANVISPSVILLTTGHSCDLTCTFANSGNLINNGLFNNTGASSNSGVLLNRGMLLDSGTLTNSGILLNSGAATISSTGLFTTSTNYTQTAGRTSVDGTLTATSGAIVDIEGGALRGTGTINGNVLMAGTMMPGDAPGTLTMFGNYEQAGTGIFKELMSPFAQAFLDVSGNVVLDPGATLDITLLGGFNPLGDTISIMDFSTLSGQFANGSSFLDDGFLWDITYRQHEIDVTAVEAVPEPSSMLLLSVGFIALGTIVKRKKMAK